MILKIYLQVIYAVCCVQVIQYILYYTTCFETLQQGNIRITYSTYCHNTYKIL